jgi:hypothetical protein
MSAYSPHEHRPLGSYAVLTAIFNAAVGGSLVKAARDGSLPERIELRDIALAGAATHKLSRLLSKDKVTSFLRAPFTRFDEMAGKGEVEESPRGSGMRLAIGELAVCPYCIAQWVAAGFTVGYVAAPRTTRVVTAIYATHALSDFLQAAYRAVEERA